MTMTRDKVRIRFSKVGDLRLVSHHDLMRCFERMLRRASIPFAMTGGFHPGPRLVFASALPLGVAGLDEVVELELTDIVEPEDVLGRLTAQLPPGLGMHAAERVPIKETARVCRAVYRIAIPEDRQPGLADRCVELLARTTLVVERPRPKPRRVDVRPYMNAIRFTDGVLLIDLAVTQEGGARADEVMDLLGLRGLLETGGVLERTTVELSNRPITGSQQTPADRPEAIATNAEADSPPGEPTEPPATSPFC